MGHVLLSQSMGSRVHGVTGPRLHFKYYNDNDNNENDYELSLQSLLDNRIFT